MLQRQRISPFPVLFSCISRSFRLSRRVGKHSAAQVLKYAALEVRLSIHRAEHEDCRQNKSTQNLISLQSRRIVLRKGNIIMFSWCSSRHDVYSNTKLFLAFSFSISCILFGFWLLCFSFSCSFLLMTVQDLCFELALSSFFCPPLSSVGLEINATV